MKILRSRLFIFIVTAIVFTGIGVIASSISASEVNYRNSTVKDAMDDIYSNLGAKMLFSSLGVPRYAYSDGNMSTSRTVTLDNLSSGRYLVINYYVLSYATSANPEEIHNELSSTNLLCSSSNCTTRFIGGYVTRKQATTAVSGSLKNNGYIAYALSYIQVNDDNDSISYTHTGTSESNKSVESVGMMVIPINE